MFTPTYASWANPIEAHFGPLRQFVLATSDLDEAYRWTNDDDAVGKRDAVLFAPYGQYKLAADRQGEVWYLPRSTSVGDVLVTPDGVAFVVDDLDFYSLARVFLPTTATAQC